MKTNNILIKFIPVLIAAFLLISVSSCKKYLELDPPPNAIGTGQAFADSATATSVVMGIYSDIATGTTSPYFRTIIHGAMSADEAYYFSNTRFDNLRNNTLIAGDDVTGFYQSLYSRIGRANYAIEGITASSMTATLKNQLVGEAKFLRAWCYFQLVNYWGDVPLVTSTDALTTSNLPRSPVVQVYQQIVADLADAKSMLGTTYPSPERARINKYVVSAFLSKVYLYTQNWQAAESEATEVINSGAYSIVTNLNNTFLNNSSETIWQISLAGTSTPATTMGSDFIPVASMPAFVLYDTLANTFEADDQRKVNWLSPVTFSGKTYYYPFKYKLRITTTGNEYPVVIRLAEVYLNRAEARANQNNVSGAQGDLDVIRNRAGLGNTTAATPSALLAALEHERWVELFTEGDRWMNLKRLVIADAVLSRIKPLWKPHQKLYPMPAYDLIANPNLKDNAGY